MKKITLITLVLLTINLYSQEYFQQEVNYKIEVELDDQNHTLEGIIHIDYTNNSNDDLTFIWFHLWPNAYKDNTTALYKQKIDDGSTSLHYATKEERGWIEKLDFKVNKINVDWKYHKEHIDICKIILNTPLKSGNTIQISTPFKVKIPDAKFSRLGHVDESYMITQWYPKPAVYDKNGWHPMPYLDQGEFYSEFGSFDVSITLPENYTVGATGDLQNKKEIQRLNELAKITDTITNFSDDMSFPKSSKTKKTLRYIQKNIHDFGWFADKRYHVLKGEVELPYSKEKVILWTMFTNNEAKLWKNSIEYMHDAVYYYSLWNGDYPYKHCTAVDGTISAGGGMEYPNVTVIGESGNAYFLEEVIMHEVGHNWFYGMLGSNEREYPWLDEGLNSHHELRYMRLKYPEYNMLLEQVPKFIKKVLDLNDYSNKQMVGEIGYLLNAWTGKDQPIELHSADYTSMNYGSIVYSKTAVVFDYLMAYLGEEMYDKCMKKYFETWKFKHPGPEDVRYIFEETTGKDLSWFFDDMIKTTKKLDYAITGIKNEKQNLIITIDNKGEIAGPVMINGIKNGKNISSMWVEGFKGQKKITYINKEYDHIRIDYNGYMTEVNRNNNTIKTKGLFKTLEPIKFQLIGSMYNPKKTQIFYHPIINYNIYNKHSFGIKLYNTFLPKGGFSYLVSPMYSYGTKKIKGKINLKYTKYDQNNIINKYSVALGAEQGAYDYNKEYTRIAPRLELQLQKSSLRSKIDNYISCSYIYLEKKEENIGFIKGKYTFSNARTFNPYSIHLELEKGEEYIKTNIIFNNYLKVTQNKGLNIRGYFGYVNTTNPIYNLKMSAWNGADDYMFLNTAFSRENKNNHNLPYQQQIFIKEGGLKHFTNDSLNSNNWLTSLNVDYKIINLLRIYAEAGTNGTNIAYGSGFKLPTSINAVAINGGLELYLPFITEQGIIELKNYHNIMRFNIKLNL